MLEEYAPDAVRYARQGKRFVELAQEYGTINAKKRVRDEWKAKCYADKCDHRKTAEDTGYEAVYARGSEKIKSRSAEYFRNW